MKTNLTENLFCQSHLYFIYIIIISNVIISLLKTSILLVNNVSQKTEEECENIIKNYFYKFSFSGVNIVNNIL